MKMLNLSDFNTSLYVIKFFDCKIKDNKEIKKVNVFKEANISYATYSRVINGQSDCGDTIAFKLLKKFGYKKISDGALITIAEKINKIYHKIYFKFVGNYEDEIEWLNRLINRKNTLEPILKLFKLLIYATITMPKNLKKEYSNLFLEIKPYENLFINDFKDLFHLVKIIFTNEINFDDLKSDYENELLLQTFSTKMLESGNIISSLYYAEKAANRFWDNSNLKRYSLIICNMMSCHNKLGEYKKSIQYGNKLLGTFESFKYNDVEYDLCTLHILISYLNLECYDEAISLLSEFKEFNMNDICCYMIASSRLGKTDYVFLNSKIQSNKDEKSELISMLNNLDDDKIVILRTKYRISEDILRLLWKLN